MTEVVLHGMHLATDFFEAVVDVLEFHTGLAKLFILAPLESFTTIVEFSSDLPMVPSCHELCVILRRLWWLGWLSMPVHDEKPTRVVYGEKGCEELAFYLTLEIISNQLPLKWQETHTQLCYNSQKAFGGRLGLWTTKQNDPSKRLLSNVVKNQRSKAKGYDLRKTRKTHTWRKTGLARL